MNKYADMNKKIFTYLVEKDKLWSTQQVKYLFILLKQIVIKIN